MTARCVCVKPLITIQGLCLLCGLERVRIKAKLAPFVPRDVAPDEAA